MPDKRADTLNKAAIRAFRGIPAEARNTLTLDNGKEFAGHSSLSEALSIDIFFAHPYHSWERGLNEHTNGLIRQYLPKKVAFDTLTQKQLDKIVDKINNRPRKILGYLTPYEVFRRKIRTSEKIPRMIILTAVFLFFFAPAALLTPLQVTRNFGNDVWRLSVIEITFSVGMMLGGILIGTWGGFKNRIYTMSLSCALCGILAVGLGVAPYFWLYLAIMAAMGLSFPLWNTPFMVLLQTTVETTFMGRVLSVFTMVSSTMMPLGMLVFGPLADTVSINVLLVGTGIIVTLLAVPLISSKTLREAGIGHI
jgi:hypothetical protein